MTFTSVKDFKKSTLFELLCKKCSLTIIPFNLIIFWMFYLLKGQKMDDMTRILPSNCSKVFIQRDFSDGTAVKFQTKFPAELDGKVKLKY